MPRGARRAKASLSRVASGIIILSFVAAMLVVAFSGTSTSTHSVLAPSRCLSSAQSTAALVRCASAQKTRLDNELASILQTIDKSESRRHDYLSLQTLSQMAQNQFETYRESECQTESNVYVGGSLYPVVYTLCVVRLDQQRYKDLLDFEASLTR